MHFGLGPAEAFGYTAASSVTRRRSSVVERILGKAEVGSSILPGGTTLTPLDLQGFFRKIRNYPLAGTLLIISEQFMNISQLLGVLGSKNEEHPINSMQE